MLKYPSGKVLKKKAQLRKKVKTYIKNLSKAQIEKKSLLIEKKLASLEAFKKAKVVLFYWPLPGEPDIKNLMRKAKKEGKVVALPLIKGKDIKPCKVSSFKKLVKGPWGIVQPKEDAPQVSLRELDLVLVPGLAFDGKRRRLGRGKGYYDRFLKKLPSKTLKVGVGFSCQFFPSLPFSLQDQKLDLVVWA